jgi:hypothetical protein
MSHFALESVTWKLMPSPSDMNLSNCGLYIYVLHALEN